jgi:hypothetical protein
VIGWVERSTSSLPDILQPLPNILEDIGFGDAQVVAMVDPGFKNVASTFLGM